MSKKAAAVAVVEDAPAAPTVEEVAQEAASIIQSRMLLCGSCKHWSRTGPSFGQCLLSGKYGHAPMITTDKISCTSWDG